MKKRIILIFFIIISTITIFLLWPKLKEPILVTVQFDEVTETLYVTYLVDKNQHKTYVMEVAHIEKGFWPLRSGEKGDIEIPKVLASQNGYELKEDIVELREHDLEYLRSLEENIVPVSIAFYNHYTREGYVIEVPMVLLKSENEGSAIKNDQELQYKYTAMKDETITSINNYHSVAKTFYKVNGEIVDLPVTLEKGNTLDILIKEPYKISSNDKLLFELNFNDGTTITKNIKMTEPIPKGYLKQIVERSATLQK